MTYAIIIFSCLLLGGRDGINYRIHGKPLHDLFLIKYWHIIGAVIYAIICYAATKDRYLWIEAAIFRLGFYDIAYNACAGKWLGYIGGEAWTDKITKKVFKNALIKAAVCLMALIVMVWVR